MKKITLYGLALCLMLFASCQRDEQNSALYTENFLNLRLTIDEAKNDAETRASTEAMEKERTVNSLTLAFFEYKNDESGTYVGSYEVTDPDNLKMNAMISVPATISLVDENGNTQSVTLDPAKSYSIVAYANLKQGNTHDTENYLMSGNSELYALSNATVMVSQAETDEEDDTHLIPDNNLFMSARAIKKANQTEPVEINLIRGVSRFEVKNTINPADYSLVSASIWAAANATPVWAGYPVEKNNTKRFYGIKKATSAHDKYFDGEEIKYGLYAFENQVVKPEKDDEYTTCLIIGLEHAGTTTYYRVNIHQPDVPQNLKRNHSYRIVINGVQGPGSSTEYEAFTQNDNLLFVSVNEWNKDDNNMLITDGVNTLGIPVRNIKLNPEGDTREYSIYTAGTGTLEISRLDIPTGFSVVIVGNVLRVTADKLPAPNDIRKGSVEISFAGLRGTVHISQEPTNDKVLFLDRYDLPNFPPVGRYGISDGALEVTASGSWIAEIVNTDDNPDNPGFSFVSQGAPVTRITSDTNPFKNLLQIYTTGNNTLQGERAGFLEVWLVEDRENYTAIVPLVQSKPDVFEITPNVGKGGVRFYADKKPADASIAVGNGYEFSINTGGDIWVAEFVTLDSANPEDLSLATVTPSDEFEILKYGRKIFVTAKKINTTTDPYKGVIRISADGKYMSINLEQDAAILQVNYGGVIPTDGGTVTVNVTPPTGMQWKAEITDQWNVAIHPAYLNNSGTTVLDNQTASSFKVGFGKLKSVNVAPFVKVKISLVGAPNIYQEIEISQTARKLMSIEVMDVRHYSYGSLGGSSNYLSGYNAFLRNKNLFGNAGRVKVPTVNITEISRNQQPGVISTNYRYLHAGGRVEQYDAARHQSIVNWYDNPETDGIVVFAADETSNNVFSGNSLLARQGYVRKTPINRDIRISTELLSSADKIKKNVMKFLLEDGPFGKVYNPGGIKFTIDGISTCVGSYPATAVPVIVNATGGVVLTVDPVERIVYIGEGQMFHTGYNASMATDKDRFLGNLLAFILKTAEGGSTFSDSFRDDDKYNEMLKH